MRKNVFIVTVILFAFIMLPLLVLAEDTEKSGSAAKAAKKTKYDGGWGKDIKTKAKGAGATMNVKTKAEKEDAKKAKKAEKALKKSEAKASKKATIKETE